MLASNLVASMPIATNNVQCSTYPKTNGNPCPVESIGILLLLQSLADVLAWSGIAKKDVQFTAKEQCTKHRRGSEALCDTVPQIISILLGPHLPRVSSESAVAEEVNSS